ncbi:DUF1993 family protein [cyanobacterium endosymbiont of Rhopalodia gibberula]
MGLSIGGKILIFDGKQFSLHFIMPNIYFHVITAYYIFYYCGV